MLHGRKAVSASVNIKNASKLGDILVAAHFSKKLSESGTLNLSHDQVSDQLVLEILRRPSLDVSKKIDFFKWCSLKPKYKHSSSTYSLMLQTLSRAGYVDQVDQVLNSMKEDRLVISSGDFKLLLDVFIRAARFDLALELTDRMEELGTGLELHQDVYSSVLVALVRKNQLSLALSILFKLLEMSDSNDAKGVDSSACSQLLVALRKAAMKDEFRKVFDRLREIKSFSWNTRIYNVCIHAFGCWGDLNTSLTLFKEMKEKSLGDSACEHDLGTYNSLIHSLCLDGKIKDAISVFEELKVSGHEPDAVTYRIIIQGCCRCYRSDDAIRLFGDMQYNGLLPTTVIYNSVLDCLFKVRRVSDACQLYERMVQDGVRASCWTHNIVIDGLFKNGKPVAAYTIFCDLKKKGRFVDGITFSIVVTQLCKEADLDEALILLEEMEGRGFKVDLVTLSSVIIGLQKGGKWDLADTLLKRVRERYLVPHALQWAANMEASLKSPHSRKNDLMPIFPSSGSLAEILRFINASTFSPSADTDEETDANKNDPWSSSPYMDRLADHARPGGSFVKNFTLDRARRVQAKGASSFDMDMVNTYLCIFLSKGKLSVACKLFEIFTEAGFDPTTYTYNSMMTAFVKKGYFDVAFGVLRQMSEKICPTDIATYNVIIQGLGKMQRADLASSVLDKLVKEGGYIDIVMYNTLINVLGKDGRIEEAGKMFEQMKASGVNADVVTYNTLIEVHSKAGLLKDAYRYLKMMLDAGCSPNHVTDTTLDFLGKEMDKFRYQKASILPNKPT
uniref:Pentatricopeptide repeat-containing protein n=1 Tax=Kalanchoe fedtschenkoi TaxID=63787 RepID=A0A7N0VEV0_KALFE